MGLSPSVRATGGSGSRRGAFLSSSRSSRSFSSTTERRQRVAGVARMEMRDGALEDGADADPQAAQHLQARLDQPLSLTGTQNGQFSTLQSPTPTRNPSVHTASTSVTAVPTTQSSSPLDLRIAVGAALGGAALLALLIVGIWLLLRKRHARYSRDQSLQWKPHPRDGASELGLPPPTPFVVGLPDSDRRERRVRRDRNQPRRAQYEHDEKRDDGLGGDAEEDDDEMTMVGHAPLATSPPRKSQFMAGALPESWPPSNQELSVPSSMPQPPPLVLAPLRAQRQASTSRTIIR